MNKKIWPFAGSFMAQCLCADNEYADDEPVGFTKWLKHGRVFYMEPTGSPSASVDHVEWCFKKELGLNLTVEVLQPYATDYDVLLNLKLGPASLYVAFKRSERSAKGSKRKRDSEYGLTVVWGLGIRILLGKDPHSWSKDDPWWREIVFHPVDRLLGQSKYESRKVASERFPLILPEGPYEATVDTYRERWKRPRWPFGKSATRFMVTPDIPVPIPGKGENSYDQEDDAYYDHFGPALHPSGAVGRFEEAVMDTRSRYGGEGWEPKDGWPVEGWE